MNNFSHILSTNYGASVTSQPSWNLCDENYDDNGDIDYNGNIDDDDGNYRVFFLTGTSPKISKYKKVNLG